MSEKAIIRKRKFSYAQRKQMGLSPDNNLTIVPQPAVVLEMDIKEESVQNNDEQPEKDLGETSLGMSSRDIEEDVAQVTEQSVEEHIEEDFDETSFVQPVMLFGKKVDLHPIYSASAFNLMGDGRQGGIPFFQNNTKTYK